MRPRDERGAAGTLLVAAACLCVAVAFATASVLVQWVLVVRQAEQAADLSALAAAGAAATEGPACAAARASAVRNNAVLAGCEVRGDGRRAVVEIAVEATLEPRLPGAPRFVVRTATAGT